MRYAGAFPDRLSPMELYFFGAGASAAEGAPATQDFFRRAWEVLGPAFDPRIRAVWAFLADVFFTPITGPAAFDCVPAVDEVISLVDWSLQANQGLGRRYDSPALRTIRRNLEHLLCVTLELALGGRAVRAAGPHARFARALAERSAPGDVALVSLNYDTLLDDALAAAGLKPCYALQDEAAGAGPILAKLHGSLNWGHCTACGFITVDGDVCSRCANPQLHGLIISPTWLKRYAGAHLERVWDRALTCVQQAERITFVGYSMPPADVAIYQLIRRGLLLRRDCRLPAITVVNHTNPQWSEAERAMHEQSVRSRFCRLFGADVAFCFAGFDGRV